MEGIIMSVKELNRDQLIELKQDYLVEWTNETGELLSWEDIASADDEIPDGWIYDYYANHTFSNDDFWCTAGMED
jgi:hypothetical protein